MTEVSNNILNELFTAGMTREQFIDKYKQIASSGTAPKDISLFSATMDDNTVGALFDSVHIERTGSDYDTLSESDVKNLASLDGNADEISDADLSKLYEQLIQQYQNSVITTDSAATDTPSITPAEGLDILNMLKLTKTRESEIKKIKLQSEIDDLIRNDSSISSELKNEYEKSNQNLKNAQAALQAKQNEYNDNNEQLLSIKEQISRKQGEIDGTQNEDKKDSLQTDIHELSSSSKEFSANAESIYSDMSTLQGSISSLKKSMSAIINKIDKSGAKTAKKIKEKQAEIEQIDSTLQETLSMLDNQIKLIEEQQLTAIQSASSDSARYADIADGTVSDGHVGKNAAQALSNATSQIGVREATGHNDGAQIDKYRNGAHNNASWCASFVSWCYKGNDIFGYQSSVSGIQMAAQKQGLYAAKGSYVPKAGDVMIQKNGASHTGIVESVDADGTVHTIEGNASNQVKRCTYKPGSRGYSQISGFVKMSERESA